MNKLKATVISLTPKSGGKLINTLGVGTEIICRLFRCIGEAKFDKINSSSLYNNCFTVELIEPHEFDILYTVSFQGSQLYKETITKSKFEEENIKTTVQYFEIEANTMIPEQISGLEEGDEVMLSDVIGNINNLYSSFNSVLLSHTKTGKEISNYFNRALYVDSSYTSLNTAKEAFEWLSEKFNISQTFALGVLQKFLPVLGFGVKGIDENGLAVQSDESLAMKMDIDEMGSGYKKLFALLPLLDRISSSGELMILGSFSDSIHPNLERALVNDWMKKFKGQLISQFRTTDI